MKRADMLMVFIAALLLIVPLVISSYQSDAVTVNFQNGTFNLTRWNASGWVDLNETGGNYSNGTFVSRVFNATLISNWTNISWSANVSQGNATFMAGSSNNASLFTFSGPDGTAGSVYALPGDLNVSIGRYFQYFLNMTTWNVSTSPKVYNVTIGYEALLPVVSLITPALNHSSTISNVTFVYNISSLNPIINCSLLVDGTEASANTSILINGTANNISYALSNGNYSWAVECTDPLGNQVNTTSRNISVAVADSTAPLISFGTGTPADGSTVTSSSQTVNVTITEPYGHSAFIDWNESLLGWWNLEYYNSTAVLDNGSLGRAGNFTTQDNTSITSGYFGNGIYLQTGYLELGDDPLYHLNGARTFEAWFKLNYTDNWRSILARDESSFGGYWLGLDSANNVEFMVNPGDANHTDRSYLSSGVNINDSDWHHVAATYNTTHILIYVDGYLNHTPHLIPDLYIGNGTLQIGHNKPWDVFFGGYIDEVRIWSRALSASEVNASFNAGLYGLQETYTGLTDGSYQYKAIAIDGSGNINSTPLRTFTLDTVSAPSVILNTPNDTLATSNTSIIFSCNATDTNYNTNITNITFYWNASGSFSANLTGNISGQANTTSFSKSSLTDGTYLWNCYACDNASNCGFASANFSLRIDTTAPLITSVQNGSPTNYSVMIAWNTNENANATINFGINTSLISGSNISTTLATTHSLILTGLTNTTLYYYNITACDSLGNCNTTGPFNFTSSQNPPPDLTAPTITNNTNGTTSAVSVIITWNTGELANSSITYGTNTTLGVGSNSSATYSTSHSLMIQGLTNLTIFYYNLTSCDPAGNCNSTGTHNFTTLFAPDTTTPVITLNSPSNMQVLTNNTVNFNCTVADYNLTNVTLFGNWSGTFAMNGTNSSGTNTDYVFQRTLGNGSYSWACHACDAAGNCGYSTNRTIQVGWVALTVVSTTPDNGATNASVISPITVQLNSPIDESTVNSSIKLLGPSGPFFTTTAYDNATYIVTLSPGTPLEFNTTYTINISSGLRGLLGSTLGADTLSVFRTIVQDTDGDGNPDHNDTDDDNDGLNDTVDFVKGNASSIYSSRTLMIDIGGSSNLSQIIIGTRTVRINDTNGTIVEFDHTFTQTLDLSNISILLDATGPGSTVVKGIPATKTIWVNDTNSKVSDACVRDAEISSVTEISPQCDGTDETFLRCDGGTRGGFTCTQTDRGLKIEGLSHSGAIEQCQERWECSTWIPMLCYLGWDQTRECTEVNHCNTSRYQPMSIQLCENPVPSKRRGCRAEWTCKEWGECEDGIQYRECENVGQCPDHVKPPIFNQTCEVIEPVETTPEDTADLEGSGTGGTTGTVTNEPTTEQPTNSIFDDDQTETTEDSGDESGSIWPYMIILFLTFMLVGMFFAYRSALFVNTRQPRYINVSLKQKKRRYKKLHRQKTWGIFWKKARRFRDIMVLQKMKRFRQHELNEIRKIVREVKEAGEDSLVAKFMRFDIEEPPKLKAPEKPKVKAQTMFDKALCLMYKIPHERETSKLDKKISTIKERMNAPVDHEPGTARQKKEELKAEREAKKMASKAHKGLIQIEKLKRHDESQEDPTKKKHRNVLEVGSLMSRLRGLHFQDKVKDEKGTASFIQSLTQKSKDRLARLHLGDFSVKKHRKDLADLERSGYVYRWIREHDGKWSHQEWEALLTKIKELGYDVEGYELGPVLEMEKRRFKVKQDLGK